MVATRKNSMEVPKKKKKSRNRVAINQKSHSWVYIRRKLI